MEPGRHPARQRDPGDGRGRDVGRVEHQQLRRAAVAGGGERQQPSVVLGAVRGGEQKILTLGANWYLNPALRMMVNWQQSKIDRLNAAGAQIGQKFNTVAARAQFTF